ncbi:ABC transporter permease subunit [Rossellomorea vietnamensis]|uniref:ABC transporter permease subunit n=1 Tax=Rossellomorea vietnamensis TaxID=218284 RepID=A0ACD4CCB7_9BACI|nr:ABC transporter permease subunit [Rossellomorea vietnamensis]UXH46180.1 ABC transporter permease subunit [Rossellomorea vietnamensis]
MNLKSIGSMVLKFVFVLFGIILLTGLIGLFNEGVDLSLKQYMLNIVEISTSLVHSESMTITNESNNSYPMFPAFWEPYFYSVSIFLSAFLLSILMGIFLAYLTHLLPSGWSTFILRATNLLESTPDIFILIVIQYSVIFILKETGVLLFPIVGSQEKVYFVPIVTLCILPTIMLFRIIYLLVSDEYGKPYVDLIKSRGMSKHSIFFIHVLRNISFSLLNHSKSIILFLLSSLIVFERLFNIYGITHFILSFSQMDVICFSLIMFYLPVFVLLILIRLFVDWKTGQKVAI